MVFRHTPILWKGLGKQQQQQQQQAFLLALRFGAEARPEFFNPSTAEKWKTGKLITSYQMISKKYLYAILMEKIRKTFPKSLIFKENDLKRIIE